MDEIQEPELKETWNTDGVDEDDTENEKEELKETWNTDGVDEDDTENEKEETVQGEEDGEEAILKSLSDLNDKMDQMNLLFTKRIQYTAHEEKILDQMHAELQKYKDDMYAQLVRPILLDIIEIRDSIRRVSSSWASKPEFASKSEQERMIPLKIFSDYMLDIQDVLEKNNITVYDSKEGDTFSASRQRAIKKVTTPAEELHGKIAESLNSGYEYMGKTISPEKVAVYICQKTEATEGEN